MAATKSNISLKLLIDKAGQRVLFAEAGKDFIDFLFSLLALPVGTVMRLLDNRDMTSGLAKLYKSVNDLSNDYIQSNQNKDVLLKPKSLLPFLSNNVLLLPNETFSSPPPNSPTIFYRCGYCKNESVYSCNAIPCRSCGRTMTTTDNRYVLKSLADAKGGGFVKGLVTYVVMDDLAVSPMSSISNLLNKFNIKGLGSLEEKVVHIGTDEGLELLKHSLSSKTVLTDVFLGDVVGIDDKRKRSKKCSYGK